MEVLKIIRQFERFNFHSVPEEPEQSFDRNSYNQYDTRMTGKPAHSNTTEIDLSNATLIGYLVDDFEKKTLKFERTENNK